MFSIEMKVTSFFVASVLLLVAMSATSVSTTLGMSTVSTAPRLINKRNKWELDTATMLTKSDFKIKPAQLLERCKEVVGKNIGLDDADDIADDFVFQFPVVGPLSKKEYLDAVRGFKITDGFPDLNAGFCEFRVDPFRHNRVWFTSYFAGTNSGEGGLFGKPTGKYIECPPQAISLTFNEAGQVTYYTGGYVMDRTLGNTGGLGGIFGPLYACGKGFPFPEAKPWVKSWQYKAFSAFGAFAGKIQKMTAKK